MKCEKFYCAFGMYAPLSTLHRLLNPPITISTAWRRLVKLGNNTSIAQIERAIMTPAFDYNRDTRGNRGIALKRFFPPRHCSNCHTDLIIGGDSNKSIRKGMCRLCYERIIRGHSPRGTRSYGVDRFKEVE